MGPEFTHLLDSLGWALVHSLWQCGVAFICVVLMRSIFRNASPSLRYAGQMFVLIACFAAFAITFALYAGQSVSTSTVLSTSEPASTVFGSIVSTFETTVNRSSYAWPDISSVTPLLALAWAVGFIVLSMKYAFAYGQVQQLRVLGVTEAPPIWNLRFQKLTGLSGISKSVALHISQHIDGPMTMGFFKPVVLVPTGFLTGIPADQVEAVLLHELAHIRRHDYAFNLIQTGVKTVLFYHPAIHIISRWIDRDREQACDDMAVARGDNPIALVRGLAALRLQSGTLAMAATGRAGEEPLLTRLTRLVGQTSQSPRKPEHVLMSLLSALMIGTIYVGATARADAHPHPVAPLAAVQDPNISALSDTRVVAAPPVSPPPPVFPPLDFSNDVDERVFQNYIKTDKALWKAFSKSMRNYEQALESYTESNALDEENLEALVETYEDLAERVEDAFEERREAIEDEFEDYIESRDEAHDLSEKHTHTIARKVQQAVKTAQRTAEKTAHTADQLAAHKLALKAHKTAVEQAQIESRRAQAIGERHRLKAETRREAHEAFRDEIMRELLRDGLIKSKSDKVYLSHPDNVMSLNGQALPKKFRDKYCQMLDDNGFTDNHSEITITPQNLTILTDYENGQHKTRVTYGSWED